MLNNQQAWYTILEYLDYASRLTCRYLSRTLKLYVDHFGIQLELYRDDRTNTGLWTTFLENPSLNISKLTILHLCPDSEDLLDLLEDLQGVRELKIMGYVGKVRLERSFWTSRLTVLCFQGDALSEAYMENWADNAAALSEFPNLITLYFTTKNELPRLDVVLSKFIYNVNFLLGRIRSPRLTTFVFRMHDGYLDVDAERQVSIFRSIVGFVRAHSPTLRTLLLDSGLNFTKLLDENNLHSLVPENEPLELQLTSFKYTNLNSRREGAAAWPRALSRINWHGLQELHLKTYLLSRRRGKAHAGSPGLRNTEVREPGSAG